MFQITLYGQTFLIYCFQKSVSLFLVDLKTGSYDLITFIFEQNKIIHFRAFRVFRSFLLHPTWLSNYLDSSFEIPDCEKVLISACRIPPSFFVTIYPTEVQQRRKENEEK